MWKVEIQERGSFIFPPMFLPHELKTLEQGLTDPGIKRSRAGVRHALRIEAVAKIAREPRLLEIAKIVLGPGAVPYHATLFEKSPDANWLVVWHQDTALPLVERTETQGWGPWSVKEGVTYAHAPASALSKVLALRVHLDDSTTVNGPLRILPGTHQGGVLSDDAIHGLSQQIAPVECLAARGGVVAMRPLVVHASSKSLNDAPRRILHLEYAPSIDIEENMKLAIA